MKKMYLLVSLFLCQFLLSNALLAQEQSTQNSSTFYRKFRLDISPLGLSGGLGITSYNIYVEPKYRITNNLSVGLLVGLGFGINKFEKEKTIVTKSDGTSFDATSNGASVLGASGSIMATADWHLKTRSSFRPYIGMGVGLFSFAGLGVTTITPDASPTNKYTTINGLETGDALLFSPRIGFDISHFRINVSYNFVAGANKDFKNTKVEDISKNTLVFSNVSMPNLTYNSINVSLVLYIGGGKK